MQALEGNSRPALHTNLVNEINRLLESGKSADEIAHKLDIQTAVEKGILVPVRCIRIKTNIDLRDVRYNGPQKVGHEHFISGDSLISTCPVVCSKKV